MQRLLTELPWLPYTTVHRGKEANTKNIPLGEKTQRKFFIFSGLKMGYRGDPKYLKQWLVMKEMVNAKHVLLGGTDIRNLLIFSFLKSGTGV
jgi:hypothetical protein